MVYLLQTIAFQNYSISPLFVNATSLPTPFNTSVPDWALWVNGLWFASLVISLATASLGILVQSWLREYLAGEWISPQEKLRARQYRHPAMEHWRVFEIAAALPLLLQVFSRATREELLCKKFVLVHKTRSKLLDAHV